MTHRGPFQPWTFCDSVMWCTGGFSQAEGTHLPVEKPWLAYCLFIQRTIFWDNLNFVLGNTTCWSYLFLERRSRSASIAGAVGVVAVPPLLHQLGKRCHDQGCCVLQAAGDFVWFLPLVWKSERRQLAKPQENFWTLMGRRIKWAQKALFWLTGASRKNISGRGEAGTVGETASSCPIPCRQQGALDVLGMWKSPLGLSGMGQPSPLV